jgi:tetratricopeptide (TPR) repeat protein
MKIKRLIILGLILFPFYSFSQIYTVQVEDRAQSVSLTNQGIVLIDENKIDEAFASLKKAITIDSTYHPTYLMLYKAFLLDTSYSKTVVSFLKKGQRIFIEDDELAFYLGETYRIISDLENAILAYTDAIRFSKINGEDFDLVYKYHFNRGNCFYKLNSVDSAISDYNYSLKLKPDYSPALLNRGICSYKKGNSSNACSDWTKALEFGSASAKEYIEKYCKNNK